MRLPRTFWITAAVTVAQALAAYGINDRYDADPEQVTDRTYADFKPISTRAFLRWTINEVKPLAEALNMRKDLTPLIEMSEGGRNTSEKIRARLHASRELGENDEVPLSVLKELFFEHEAWVKADVEREISAMTPSARMPPGSTNIWSAAATLPASYKTHPSNSAQGLKP